MSEQLNRQLEATAVAEGEAEQKRKEYLAAQHEPLKRRKQELVPVVSAFLDREYPRLANDANSGVVVRYLVKCNLAATDANLELAVSQLESELSLKQMSDQEWRDYLEGRIMELVVASPEEKERLRASFHARMPTNREEMAQGHEKTGPYLVTTVSMAQRLVNLKESERLRSLSHSELRAEVRGNAQPYGYPPLPAKFSRRYIKFVMSGSDVQDLIKRYGQGQIDQRLREQEGE